MGDGRWEIDCVLERIGLLKSIVVRVMRHETSQYPILPRLRLAWIKFQKSKATPRVSASDISHSCLTMSIFLLVVKVI